MTALLALVSAQALSAGPEPPASSDERFVESLATAPADAPVETRRLARLLFGVAATLEGGRTGVRLLEEVISVREPDRASIQGLIHSRYETYSETAVRFKEVSLALLDDPDSRPLLYRTLMDGHQACWRLDALIRLSETYGASAADLRSVLASVEACDLFRRAAFQPRVEAVIQDSLAGGTELAEQNRELREELHELEQLLEDLRTIEERE